MSPLRIAVKSLTAYWRTALATAACCAVATAVIAGSLLVGASVRNSLREKILGNLGMIRTAVATTGYFDAIENRNESSAVLLDASVATQDESTLPRAAVLGVDEGLFRFYGQSPPAAFGKGEAIVSRSLADGLHLSVGDRLFVSLPKPGAAPENTVFGHRLVSDRLREVSVVVGAVIADEGIAGLSLDPSFRPQRSLIVRREWLARQIGRSAKANVRFSTLESPAELTTLSNLGLDVREAEAMGGVVLSSDRIVLTEPQIRSIRQAVPDARVVGISLATRIGNGSRSIAYATVASIEGMEQTRVGEWAAKDLAAAPGSTLLIETLEPLKDGSYGQASVQAAVDAVFTRPEPALVPVIEGLTNEPTIDDWEPPFPLNLARITPRDEAYWDRYRAAPKLFVPEKAMESLGGVAAGVWFPKGSRKAVESALLTSLDPEDFGVRRLPLRSRAEAASKGTTDLGGLLLALGFVLIASALMLSYNAVSLNLLSRTRDVALLRALGVSTRTILATLGLEHLAVAALGALAGIPFGILLAAAALRTLETLMPPALGFERVSFHLDPPTLLVAWACGAVAAGAAVLPALMKCVRLPLVPSLRGLRTGDPMPRPRGYGWWAAALLSGVAALATGPGVRSVAASVCVLLLGVALSASWSAPRSRFSLGFLSLRDLGSRGWLLSVFLVAAGTLALIVTSASLRSAPPPSRFDLVVSTQLPIAIDYGTSAGRERLGFAAEAPYQGMELVRLLRSPGEDASCLNLGKPTEPRIVAVPKGFRPFQIEPVNGWERLQENERALVGEGDTVRWSLGSDLGREFAVGGEKGTFVGLTKGGFLPGDLFVGESWFRRLYPERSVPSLFLASTPNPEEVALALRRDLASAGADVRLVREELRAVRQVQNAYLMLFVGLGSLAMALGVLGMSAVALRRGAERRREFALLRALGVGPAALGV
ncbi:MAG TPA: FtsX-like permease family protein, partial [Fimbriimonas sp.]